MFLWPRALLFALLPVVSGMSSERNPNRCWINDDPREAAAAVCPLFDRELKLSVYCSVNLSPHIIENEKCRRCLWKENTERLCQPTKHWQRRICCCKRPMCNRQIYIDAMPGWDMTRYRQKEVEQKYSMDNGEDSKTVCIEATYKNGNWTMKSSNRKNYEVRANSNHADFCYMNMTVIEGKLVFLDMGLAKESGIVKRCENRGSSLGDCDTKNNSTFCCCTEPWCNQELYMQRGFDPLMEVREAVEKDYNRRMADAYKHVRKTFYYKDENYYQKKPVVDGCLVIGAAIYILVMLIIYRLYVPVDMDKRPQPPGSSVEKHSQESRE